MNVCIVGLGLIGGSFAYKLKQHFLPCVIDGIDLSDDNLQQAHRLKMIDGVAKMDALSRYDWIVLTVPVDAAINILPSILDQLNPHQLVFDASSTKAIIAQTIDHHPKRHLFISLHPMWGTEYSGPTAAQQNAFENKVCVVCDKDKSDVTKWAVVENFLKKIPMNLVEMNSYEHDIHAAYISHISHITSFALANTVLEKEKDQNTIFQLAGSGFESTVRLAKSAPDTWVPVFRQNRNNVLEVLKEHIHQLQLFETYLTNQDYDNINAYILDANRIKKTLR